MGVILESAIRATYVVEAEEILKKLAKKQKISQDLPWLCDVK